MFIIDGCGVELGLEITIGMMYQEEKNWNVCLEDLLLPLVLGYIVARFELPWLWKIFEEIGFFPDFFSIRCLLTMVLTYFLLTK